MANAEPLKFLNFLVQSSEVLFIADELFADKRYQNTHRRTIRRYKVNSLDAEDGIMMEAVRIIYSTESAIEMTECHNCLCSALGALPEKQGRRVKARFILGKSQKEIAGAEGVSEEAMSKAIEKGLAAMKKYLEEFYLKG